MVTRVLSRASNVLSGASNVFHTFLELGGFVDQYKHTYKGIPTIDKELCGSMEPALDEGSGTEGSNITRCCCKRDAINKQDKHLPSNRDILYSYISKHRTTQTISSVRFLIASQFTLLKYPGALALVPQARPKTPADVGQDCSASALSA